MELQWIGVAFVFGLIARRLGQPPLVGYLVAGLALELVGFRMDASLEELTTIGVQLLLFTIGLKLDLASVARREVWGVTLAHMVLTTAALGGVALALAALEVPLFAGLEAPQAALVGFALSFSSTVFAVKLLEERDDVRSVYGRVAIGVLVVQDLVAVVFLAASDGKLPSPFALGLVGLVLARPVLHRFLRWCGHGELLVLGGFALALGGVSLFELVDMKGDLGALVAGVVAAGHPKSTELAKSLGGFKDVFLVGFFLSVGLTGLPTGPTLALASGLLLFALLKGALFLRLFARFDLRARSSFFAGAALANYSEFGLIVGALAVQKGWLGSEWLVGFALALAFSFILGAPFNARLYHLYDRLRDRLRALERPHRLPDERPVQARGAKVLIFGMGRIGTAAYDVVKERYGDTVVGFDIDAKHVAAHQAQGRRCVLASATDADIWERLEVDRDDIELVLLAMSSHVENRTAVEQLRKEHFPGLIAATARFPDEVDALRARGADLAVHVMAEAGMGFARDALERLDRRSAPPPAPA
ncbi:MAG: cation:proton antiporter [Sandaracinaceae bacterium]|nr:cation:proton antiporter [Sandaracinaceae bacterium]